MFSWSVMTRQIQLALSTERVARIKHDCNGVAKLSPYAKNMNNRSNETAIFKN